ncbi:MAG: class I SAM-dependent methyltransferase, partial [Verrucomicrobiota bacterium]
KEHLLPLVDGLKAKLEKGIEVLDVGCGSGRALIALAIHYPQSRFTGYDLCEEAVIAARNYAKAEGVTNVTFQTVDVSRSKDVEKFDLIFTFDAVHDQAKPDVVLKYIYTALKPDGLYFMQDIAGSSNVAGNMEHMLAPFIYTISCMHCMSVSLAQGGAGLGAMWGKELALKMLAEAGFKKVDVEKLEHDIINYYYLVRK